MTVLSWLKRNNIIKCNHQQNNHTSFYVISKTPHIKRVCEDCGWVDEGHVHGDIDGWYGSIIVKNGKIVEDTTGIK